ncbi:MAG: hypothetical protein DWI26_01720 [Planctomycetota bacterium]|nr:MAG: hypothetical protein DWI26_01720 [Planctomycetota bacterium]
MAKLRWILARAGLPCSLFLRWEIVLRWKVVLTEHRTNEDSGKQCEQYLPYEPNAAGERS